MEEKKFGFGAKIYLDLGDSGWDLLGGAGFEETWIITGDFANAFPWVTLFVVHEMDVVVWGLLGGVFELGLISSIQF
jgi:hypothetical protein